IVRRERVGTALAAAAELLNEHRRRHQMADLVGQFGVFADQRFHVRFAARTEACPDLLRDQAVRQGHLILGCLRGVVHARAPLPGSPADRISLRRNRARPYRIVAADGLSPSVSPTSALVIPSKSRIRITSRSSSSSRANACCTRRRSSSLSSASL